MDSQLMDKEVLCILDTRQIQRFMFRSNSYVDTLGGSDLLNHVLEDGILSALQSVDPPLKEDEYDLSLDPDAPIPYFENEKVLFQIIICTAGNAMFVARTGRLAQQIIRKVSRYYIDHAYSLNMAAAAVEKTGNLGYDISELYRKLNNAKTSAVISDPLGALPVVLREKRTGLPVYDRDKERGDYISRASFIRRQEAQKRGKVISLNELRTTKGANGKNYRAVLHVDGNNIGITIGRVLQQTPDYQKGIHTRRRINGNLQRLYEGIMKRTLAQLQEYYEGLGRSDPDFAHEFQIIHNSGDDINCMCNADLAFPFLDIFFANLEGGCIGEVDGRRIPLYCCGGISFVTEESDFHTAFKMAEECCESAKKTSKLEKNLRDGLAGNWIDFQICESPYHQELDMLRLKSYVTDTNVNLALRPYCLDEVAKDEEYAYGRFRERALALHSLKRKYGMRWLNHLAENYSLERIVYLSQIYRLKEKGLNLEKLLGAPYYKDENKDIFATWFDALEVLPFIPEHTGSGEGGSHG
ncbi:MAG: hypothetical protein IJ088_10880 [Clostridia bacterium]|nr:hypothetical protein [Clostridia bacterium]